MRDDFTTFREQLSFAVITTEMVEHKICLLTWALSHIGHVNNTGMANESTCSASQKVAPPQKKTLCVIFTCSEPV